MRIEQLSISNFRGFRDECPIAMGASVVIVRGPNGSGKTSLLDAIQWLLLGDVPRLKPSVLKKDEDYLSNRYASGPPFVEASLGDGDGETIRISRRGLGDSMQVQVDLADGPLIGQAAQRWLEESMSSAVSGLGQIDLLRRYLLQQDDMREFLDANTKERYEFIAALTGMERLNGLDTQMREELKAARKSVRDLEEKLKSAGDESEKARDIASEARELATRRDETAGIADAETRARRLLGTRAANRGVAEMLTELRELSGTIEAQLDRLPELDRRERRARERLRQMPRTPTEQIAEMTAEAEALRGKEGKLADDLTRAESKLAAARAEANKSEQLAALALEQIEGDCPVCGQKHDVEGTRVRLTTLLDTSPELADLSAVVDQQREELAKARHRLVELDLQLLRLRGQAEEIAGEEEALTQLAELRKKARRELRTLVPVDDRSDSDPDLVGSVEAMKRGLDSLVVDLQRTAEAAVRIERAARRVVVLDDQVATEAQRLDSLSAGLARQRQRVKRAEAVRSSLGGMITEVMNEVANGSTGLINEIYASLDVHPTFREFGFRTQRHFEAGHLRPWVYDRRRKISGNALQVLSAAQLNSLAICLFLALNLEHDARLRTAILDDPVQSLDDVNLLSLADVLRTVRSQRQVIVSTHDELLAELLTRKLRPLHSEDSTVVVTVDRWSEAGPRVCSETREVVSLEPELELLADAGS